MTIRAPFVDEARPMYPRGTLPGALFLYFGFILFQQASGAPDMTQDEINAEIAAVRAARKAVKQ